MTDFRHGGCCVLKYIFFFQTYRAGYLYKGIKRRLHKYIDTSYMFKNKGWQFVNKLSNRQKLKSCKYKNIFSKTKKKPIALKVS